MEKNRKSFGNGGSSEETGKLYFNKNLRLISISGMISRPMADEFFEVLTGFESLSLKKPLTIYISSEGGGIYDMFRIYDNIRNSPLSIATIATGYVSSAGFIIFLAGDLRIVFPNVFLGFHAPTVYFIGGGSEGPAEAKESAIHQNRILDVLVKIIKDNSNMSEKMIRKYLRILTRIDSKTALKFGLAHQIISPPKKILPKSWPAFPKLQRG